MTLNVHLQYAPSDEALALLTPTLSSDIRLTMGKVLPDPADYHILVGGRPEERHLKASPHLRALVVPWAGLPEETVTLMSKFPDVAVHNLHHNAAPVAELALALLLSAAKFIVPYDHSLRRHDWTPRYHPTPSPSILLSGKTALILGYGAIGRHVAGFCQAFGMSVLAVKRELPTNSDDSDVEVYGPEALRELLPRANAIFICLPLTPETKGIIGAEELGLLPNPATLVNIARGAIVDEAALYHALRSGQLRAAGLDVWYNYPRGTDEELRANTPPANYPFHELDNVVMSPHRGGATDETDRLRMTYLAELLNEAARGGPMPNRVDMQAGY
jgi:phosphoglycerate dehydrogenase-like enzyme